MWFQDNYTLTEKKDISVMCMFVNSLLENDI